VMLPFAACREMCYRMTIASERDKHFGAFMACQANEDPNFQYAGYVMAYRYCLNALPSAAASRIDAQANAQVKKDVAAWEAFVTGDPETKTIDPDKIVNDLLDKEPKPTQEQIDTEVAELLVSWHHQQIVLPSLVEPEVVFDPYDETLVDMTGLPHVPQVSAE